MKDKVFEELVVVKRSGQRVVFNDAKIAIAIKKAFDSIDTPYKETDINRIYEAVLNNIQENYENRKTINVEDIQDIIEEVLKEKRKDVYESFSEYRHQRAASRELFAEKQKHKFVKSIEKIGLTIDNSNTDKIDCLMTKFGEIVSNEFAKAYLIENKYVRSHDEGNIFIHYLDYYSLGSIDSSHLNLNNIASKDINEFTDTLIEIIQNVELYSECSIPNIDKIFEKKIISNFKVLYKDFLYKYLNVIELSEYLNFEEINLKISELPNVYNLNTSNIFKKYIKGPKTEIIFKDAYVDTINLLNRALEYCFRKLLRTLNKANKRITISIGQHPIISNIYLNVLNEFNDLNNVTTVIKIDDKLSLDLNKAIIANKKIILLYKAVNQEVFSNGLVINNNIVNNQQGSNGRMILSNTAINLNRLGLKYNKTDFYNKLSELLELVKNQMLQRFDYQANKYLENYEYLFANEMVIDSQKLEAGQKVRKVIKNGVFNISIVGLFECVYNLNKKDNFDISSKDIDLAVDIVKFIKKKCSEFTNSEKLNFEVSEESDPFVLKKLIGIDKTIFGCQNVLAKEKYNTISEILEHYPVKERINIHNEFQKYISTIIVVKKKDNLKPIDLIDIMKNNKVKYIQVKK